MNEILFAISFALIALLFIKRVKLVDYISEKFNIRIESEVIVAIVTVLVIILVLAGMLLDDTKKKYSNISDNYDNLKPKTEQRPHRYFDVNTYD